MPTFVDLKCGQAIWIEHYGEHPAVVLEEGEDAIVTIVGTSKRKDDPNEVVIKPKSAAATVLGLSLPTYFYPSKICVVRDPAVVTRVRRDRCPPGVFHQLEALASLAAAQPAIKKPRRE